MINVGYINNAFAFQQYTHVYMLPRAYKIIFVKKINSVLKFTRVRGSLCTILLDLSLHEFTLSLSENGIMSLNI